MSRIGWVSRIPFNRTAALDLIDNMVPYLRWQSNTAWLKNPPAEYVKRVQPAHDVWGELDKIRRKTETESYPNELTQKAHDGHFSYKPDIVRIFRWARPIPLVSVSDDGLNLPKTHMYTDILEEAFFNGTTPSPITKINGRNAHEYLEDFAQYGRLQDRDALYNSLFYNLAAIPAVSFGTGIGAFAGDGWGKYVRSPNKARVMVPFSGITDASTRHSSMESRSPTSYEPSEMDPVQPPGYPPLIEGDHGSDFGGYFLDRNHTDTAVLALHAFVSDWDHVEQFQQRRSRFIEDALAGDKKRLIIDLSSNGGGTALQPYDVYKKLFPNAIDHALARRFRAFESTDLIGRKYSKVSEGVSRNIIDGEQNETLYDLQLDYGAQYSNLIRPNLWDNLMPYKAGIWIHGTRNQTYPPNTTQPFANDDIVVITDGHCSSACTTFAELLRQRQGIRFVSIGGCPREGLIQAVGGVKGGPVVTGKHIREYVKTTIRDLSSSPWEEEALRKSQLGEYLREIPFDRLCINFMDDWRDEDLGVLDYPLQFHVEDTDCRILYTKEMVLDVTAIWKAVADIAWGGKACFAGGLSYNEKKKEDLRTPRAADIEWSEKVRIWRDGRKAEDYPLDNQADYGEREVNADAFAYP
ncbi:hypothetical protein M011DRAFT_497895 [Sporormia fimetaria CBS 119925]|uniref:Uncharacterized protein n=1 Tax=Sporormia fimetaria CBS 119925 TaxID=1340428 RepID=A0A6A6UUG5_9PLEO|nr:hypothetical protein M011DRAFT_497895 [Sporormia fimetaria CBS 119925]